MESYLFPLLSEYDPITSSEGGLDPLGLYSIADALAEKLVPAVRERQKHPRFLTAMAVAADACKGLGDDIAKDGVSPPWQVFEWYLVEGFVRSADTEEKKREIQGVPGTDKARQAIRDKVPLSAKRYLKNPSVFGFHGVYRVLADNLDIVQGERMGEIGYTLLTTWAEERRLKGFVEETEGEGSDIRRQLISAIHDGLRSAATARSGGWGGWTFFLDHLSPLGIGRKEKEVIKKALFDPSEGYRHEVAEFLISPEGRRAWEASLSELNFHEELRRNASGDLKALLDAIEKYEKFSRMLQDLFDDCLAEMTRKRAKISLKELASLESAKGAGKNIPKLYMEVTSSLEPLGQALELENRFSGFSDEGKDKDFINQLLEHHIKTQREKPPAGKNPWFERFEDGGVVIRPGYRRDQGGLHDRSYLHFYRTNPLWSFANDLRIV